MEICERKINKSESQIHFHRITKWIALLLHFSGRSNTAWKQTILTDFNHPPIKEYMTQS